MTCSRSHCSYLTGISSGTPRYTTWFGEYDNGRKDLVQSHFEKIGDSPKSVTYDCSSCSKTMDHSDDVFAYVDPNESVQSSCVDNYDTDVKAVPAQLISVASRHYYIHEKHVSYITTIGAFWNAPLTGSDSKVVLINCVSNISLTHYRPELSSTNLRTSLNMPEQMTLRTGKRTVNS